MIRRAGFGLVLAVTAVSVAACYRDDTCERLTAIAADSQKVQYVRKWAAARISDERFMDAVREYPFFERGRPRAQQFIDLDWRYLGLDPEFAWVGFNTHQPDLRTVQAAGIGSLSLNESRSSLIVGLRADGDLGLELTAEDRRRLKSFGNDIFLDCDL
jgi:hypothetical protein